MDPIKIKKFDTVIFAGSLCKTFRKNLNNFHKKKYLISDKNKDINVHQSCLFDKKKLKIGISWKSVISIYGKLKSIELSDFQELFNDDRQIINLQYGDTKEDIADMAQKGFNIYSYENINLYNDIESCMSILKNIDVFVTVSNTTAHIAASMGVNTFLICPKKSSTYFYWNVEDNNTPWYYNVKIFQVNDTLKKTINKINKLLEKV